MTCQSSDFESDGPGTFWNHKRLDKWRIRSRIVLEPLVGIEITAALGFREKFRFFYDSDGEAQPATEIKWV
jgi:hypothetical protein